MDISNLSPKDQQTFLSLLGQVNQQSVDPQGSFPGNMNQQPQPTQSIQQQEGDKMHPMDAISQIANDMGQQAGPQAPAGVSLATGMKLGSNDSGQLTAKVPASQPLLNLLGVKQTLPVTEPNYYQTIKGLNLDKFLPTGLPQTPDGTPFVSGSQFSELAKAKGFLPSANNINYTTKDQLTAVGLPDADAQKLLDANPSGVSDKALSKYQASHRLDILGTMAQAKADMVGIARVTQALKVGGFDAAQGMAQQADKNLLLANKAQALIDQIDTQGGKANIRQQAELGRNLAALVATNNGVVTDEGMSAMVPKTAMQKYGGWNEFFTNSQEPIDFSGFLPQMRDLVNRERMVNQGISNAPSQLGINIMKGMGRGQTATAVGDARNASPLVGNNPPNISMTPPIARPPIAQNPGVQPHFNSVDDVKAAYQAGKLDVNQAKALVKAMHKGQ